MKINKIEREYYTGKVYNIGVDDYHNYFVEGVMVSNCYVEASHKGTNFEDIVPKLIQFFGEIPLEKRPFQLAIGGSGEPTLHPDFPEFLRVSRELGIMPNYTTNAMNLTEEVLEATERYAGGVAITCHKHLRRFWEPGILKLAPITRLNLHIIPMCKEDVDDFVQIFYKYKEMIEYFVILPYQSIGFGGEISNIGDVHAYLFDEVLANMSPEDLRQVAYGAYFYDALASRPWLKASLYDHNVFSKYIVFEGSGYICNSSYDWNNPVRREIFNLSRL